MRPPRARRILSRCRRHQHRQTMNLTPQLNPASHIYHQSSQDNRCLHCLQRQYHRKALPLQCLLVPRLHRQAATPAGQSRSMHPMTLLHDHPPRYMNQFVRRRRSLNSRLSPRQPHRGNSSLFNSLQARRSSHLAYPLLLRRMMHLTEKLSNDTWKCLMPLWP